MLARVGLQAPVGRFAARSRTFRTSAVSLNSIHGTPKEGIYSNLPFKVKNTKLPFGIGWWGTFGFFFAFPFLSAYWHMKKAGNI